MVEKELCGLTKQLMLTCLGGHNLGKMQEFTRFLANNAVVIGSRSNEIYTSVEQIKSELDSDKWMAGRDYICRPVKDWFQSFPMSESVKLVCGNIKFEIIFSAKNPREAAPDGGTGLSGLTETEVRISVLWRWENGEYRIAHIHFSLPEDSLVPCKEAEWNTETCEEPSGGMAREKADYYRELSERDLMTGLYNRGSFEWYVKQQLADEGGGTFYMIDLDDFKAVNDTYGHAAGDRVIMGMADILRKVFHETAVIGRLGGDEFAVFENRSNTRKESEEKARNVLDAYRTMSVRYGNEIILSCSIGLYREKGKETFENLYSRADEALYFSKNSYKGTFHWYYRQGRS